MSKFHENPPSEKRLVPCGQMDRYDESNSRFSQFCKSVDKFEIIIDCNLKMTKISSALLQKNV